MSLTAVAWSYLVFAGLLEVLWAMGLKFSEGFTKPMPTIITFILVILSFFLLSKSMKVIPVSVAYAVWCAIIFILIGIVGLKISY